jgi:hypothetical protein
VDICNSIVWKIEGPSAVLGAGRDSPRGAAILIHFPDLPPFLRVALAGDQNSVTVE